MAEIISEPTVQSKVIPLSLRLNDTDTSLVSQLVTNRQFNTADTDAWFSFTLEGLAATTGTFDLTLINLQDKSVFNHTDKAFSTNPFYYKLDSGTDELTNEIRHAGKWVGQLVVTLANGDSATRKFIFGIEGHILDGTVVQTILLEDYNALIASIESTKEELTQYNIDYSTLISTVESQEAVRVQAELTREQTFNALVDSEIIAQNVATELQNVEATYAPRLLVAEQQLVDIENTKAEQSTLEVEKARIDSFTALASGSTTGDAELIDGRIGADAVTYPNIGDAIRGQLVNVNADLTNSEVKRKIDFSTATNGKYINSAHGVSTSARYSYIGGIVLKKNEKIIFKATGYLAAIAMIAKQNSNGTFTALVNSIDSTEREYEYIATEDVTIVLSYLNTASYSAKIVLAVRTYIDAKNLDMDNKKANLTDVTNAEYNVVKPVANLVANGNFATVSKWSASNSVLTISNNEMIITGNGTNASPTTIHSDSMTIKGGEHYYFHAKMKVTNGDCKQIRVRTCGDYGSFVIDNPIANKWYDIYGLCKIPDAVTETVAYKLFARHTYIDAATSNNKSCKVKDVMMISLNNDFGLGVKPPEHLIKRLFERNGYWEGTQNIIVKNSEDQLPYLEKANKGYVIDNPVAHQSRSRKPIISFQCDDGYYEDYLKLHKFSDKYGVPFTSAIYKNSTMPISTMLYLQDVLGWEFNSHTYNHVVLANLATEAEIEYQMKKSKEYMESLGLRCNTIIYPEGSTDERVRRIGKKYFSCGATTNTGINTGVVPSFYLKRVGLGSFQATPTYDFYKSKVDEAIATNGWLIFMLHPSAPAHDEAQQLIIDQLIQYIISQGVEVKTLIDGYEDFGNAIEIGDYIGGAEGIAISKNGERKNI